MLGVQSAVVREGGETGMGIESGDAFPDFLDSIDFDDLFLDGDILPDLLSDYSAAASESKPDSSGSSSSSTSSGEKKDDKDKRVVTNSSHVKKTSSASSKSSGGGGGKRKVKVDWTPELHRRFVQAVEQLGVDKAVPSRILEIMGIDCLTRHNIASHLQKYRSHRKHLVAREAEAASWSQRRQLYKREATAGPTMGFPTMQMQMQMPLHVWGHPKQSPHYPPYSQYPPHPTRGVIPNAVGMPCFPHPAQPQLPLPPPPQCILPSKESIDAAIGDVMAKPWLPLPLGLKPPCMEGVMGHLQRQGVPGLPPS